MYRYLFFGTFLVLGLTARPAGAQGETAPSRGLLLTLEAAAMEALAHNPELVALHQEYEAARAAPEAERSLMPPTAEVQVWGWPVTTLNPARTDMYMLTAEQQLPGRGKRAARVLVAEREADMSRQQIAVRANAIVGDLRQAYVDLALARETVGIYQRQVRVLEDLAETATLRYAAGEGAQHHTVTSVVEISRLERDAIAARERAQTAETRLNTLLGRPVTQPVEPLAPVAGTISAADAEALALERHPDVAMAAAATAREEAELERLRRERRPDYVIGGGYMLTPGEAGAWTARAGITWPNAPWSRKSITAAIDVQAKRVDAARARQRVVAARLRQVVREAVIQLAAAERQARLIESTVLPQIEHAFELARFSYAAGEGSYADMLDARRTLLSVQLEYAEVRANVQRARAGLDTVAGAL
jgi:cobalt-zinc-cadmium efflux system outer membrane protein